MLRSVKYALFCNLQADPTFYSHTHPLFTNGAEEFRSIVGLTIALHCRDRDQVYNPTLPCHSQLICELDAPAQTYH